MKYFKYVLRNASRNKLRSALTIMSLCICLAMMTVLYGFLTMQDELVPELAKANRVLVMNRNGFAAELPMTYLDRIRSTKGAKAAVPLSWYIGMYRDEHLPLPSLATDPQYLFDVWVELKIDPEQLREWQRNRQGCVVDRHTAERRGWKIGEHIPLKGTRYPFDVDLTLCGIYDGPEYVQDMYFHLDYLDEGLRQKSSPLAGTTSIFFVKATSREAIAPLCEEIDERFRNSEHPTMSQSHQEFLQMFSKFVGNLQGFIRNIGMAVVFSLTLVAANAMAMSMRERTTEIAVLKAIGFQRGLVLTLILGESVIISLVGGVLGVAAGRGLWAVGHKLSPQFIPLAHIAWIVLAYGIAVAIGIGLISGVVPAVRAAQLSVIDGLRRLG